jgi:hypothetical protein
VEDEQDSELGAEHAEHESNQHAAAPGQRWAAPAPATAGRNVQRATRDAKAHGAQHQGGSEERKAVEGKQAKGSGGGGAAPARPPELLSGSWRLAAGGERPANATIAALPPTRALGEGSCCRLAA